MLARVVALCNSGRDLGLVPVPFMDGGLLMRPTLLVMATMSFAVLVIGGVAYALTFTCDTNLDADPDTGECKGTPRDDHIDGTEDPDNIDARAGADVVFGFDGADTIHGRVGSDTVVSGGGSDVLFGEGGKEDDLNGQSGSNEYFGGSGFDSINATGSLSGEVETISAGRGNDETSQMMGSKILSIAVATLTLHSSTKVWTT